MINNCDNGSVHFDDIPGKRQKSSAEPQPSAAFERVGDCYDEIVGGNINGKIRYSWLRSVNRICSSQYLDHPNDSEQEMLISAIETLSRQLLQVKRRLWPAAERCSEVWGSSPMNEFAEARRICNPMEPLGEGRHHGLNKMFMNRSAIKLANIDAILGFTLTSAPGNHFLFVDLCGAPGGFSEYLMKRLQSTRITGSCRGYGMSLVGNNEHGFGAPWKLQQRSISNGSFQTNYRVSGGADGTGDLYRWDNVLAFFNGIQYDIQASGLPLQKVHLVVADGGFDAQRDSECQEELSQKLVLCEFAAGLHVLRVGGTMVTKLFGFQTSTARISLQLLFDLFDEILVIKPISSRPASGERYVVFRGFRGVANDWDGPSWMNNILLGSIPYSDASRQNLYLQRYLDQVDRDIMTLNLKACFAILTQLDRKAARKESWLHDSDSWDTESQVLNVNMYKHAWKLS